MIDNEIKKIVLTESPPLTDLEQDMFNFIVDSLNTLIDSATKINNYKCSIAIDWSLGVYSYVNLNRIVVEVRRLFVNYGHGVILRNDFDNMKIHIKLDWSLH